MSANTASPESQESTDSAFDKLVADLVCYSQLGPSQESTASHDDTPVTATDQDNPNSTSEQTPGRPMQSMAEDSDAQMEDEAQEKGPKRKCARGQRAAHTPPQHQVIDLTEDE